MEKCYYGIMAKKERLQTDHRELNNGSKLTSYLYLPFASGKTSHFPSKQKDLIFSFGSKLVLNYIGVS